MEKAHLGCCSQGTLSRAKLFGWIAEIGCVEKAHLQLLLLRFNCRAWDWEKK